MVLMMCAPGAWSAQSKQIAVQQAWVREMPPGAGMTAVFMTLNNSGKVAAQLVGAESTQADSVELHGHSHEHGVMRMRSIGQLDLPAGGDTTLAPGGLHLMVMGLKTPLKAKQRFPLVLKFADGSRLNVNATVRALAE